MNGGGFGRRFSCYTHPMNMHRPVVRTATTQAAEGLPRRMWSVGEIAHLTETGFFRETDRFELIGGEIVPMSPKGIRHEAIKTELSRHFFKCLPDALSLVVETTLYVTANDFYEPDIIVWPREIVRQDRDNDVKFAELSLLVEIAHASRAYDLGPKRKLYAAHGLREYWVVDALSLTTTVHRDPREGDYATVTKHGPADVLTPSLAPALAVRLADLGLTPMAE